MFKTLSLNEPFTLLRHSTGNCALEQFLAGADSTRRNMADEYLKRRLVTVAD